MSLGRVEIWSFGHSVVYGESGEVDRGRLVWEVE